MVGGEGDDQLWRSGRGAIAGCRCSVLLWAGGVTTNFGGVDVVPLIAQNWFLLSGVYAGIISIEET